MRTRTVWLVLWGSVGWASCDVVQPLPQCVVGRGRHAVHYTLKSGTGACAGKQAETVGAQAFRVPGAGQPPTLVLKPAALAAHEGKGSSHPVTSTGDFAAEYPSAEGVCEVASLSEARQVVTLEEGQVLDLRYQWSGMRVITTAAIPGTQWTATLTYSEGDCTATYEAVGVFPAMSCVRQVDGQRVVDASLCRQPRPGLTLDPAFPVRCDEASGWCVLDGRPPALLP